MRPKQTKPTDSRRSLVEAVTTPLAFFVLVLLVSESILGAFFRAGTEYGRAVIFAGMFILLAALVAIVAFLAYTRPEVLYGKRPPKELGVSLGLVALLRAIGERENYPDSYGHELATANPEVHDGWRKASSYACLYLQSLGLIRSKGSEVELTATGRRFLKKLDDQSDDDRNG